jgi:predicted nucleotide-binding protein
MSYYNVFVKHADKKGKPQQAIEFDLSEVDVKERVAAPYLNNKPFMVDGRVIYPSDVDQIAIFVSQKNANDLLLPNGKPPLGQESSYVADCFFRKEANIDRCTSSFIALPPMEKEVSQAPVRRSGKNIFIVHGRDHKPMRELKTMLLEFGLNPIVLHEQPRGIRAIIERLEKYSDVEYAFIILTMDDVGAYWRDIRNYANLVLRARARQNVILEFGYFMGKLGRDRVSCLYKGDVELPSDIYGVVYTQFTKSVNEVRNVIVKELQAVGFTLAE